MGKSFSCKMIEIKWLKASTKFTSYESTIKNLFCDNAGYFKVNKYVPQEMSQK